MTKPKMKFRRKHPDGRIFEKPNAVWPNAWLTRFDRALKQGIEITDSLWERMIENASSEQRLLINKYNHGEDHYLVTPDTVEKVCSDLIKTWLLDGWLHDEEELAALKAIRDKTSYQFWLDLDGEYPSVTLDEFCSSYSPKKWKEEELDENIRLAEATVVENKARSKTARVTHLKSQQDDLQKQIDEINAD